MSLKSILAERASLSMLGKGIIGLIGIVLLLFKNQCERFSYDRLTDYQKVSSKSEVARMSISDICEDSSLTIIIGKGENSYVIARDSFKNCFCNSDLDFNAIDSLYRCCGLYAYETSNNIVVFDSSFELKDVFFSNDTLRVDF